MVLLEGTASRYPLLTLLQVVMHSSRDYLLSHRDFNMFSCRPVGGKSDGNSFPYLLSPTAPSTRCIGDSVARFACQV